MLVCQCIYEYMIYCPSAISDLTFAFTFIFLLPTAQCRNWDGGYQEFSTARDAVKAVFPDAKIIENRVDEYPIKVDVSVRIQGEMTTIWSGSQKNLFRKYGAARTKSIQEIKQSAQQIKGKLGL